MTEGDINNAVTLTAQSIIKTADIAFLNLQVAPENIAKLGGMKIAWKLKGDSRGLGESSLDIPPPQTILIIKK